MPVEAFERVERAMNSDYHDIRFKAVEALAGLLSGRSKSAVENWCLNTFRKKITEVP